MLGFLRGPNVRLAIRTMQSAVLRTCVLQGAEQQGGMSSSLDEQALPSPGKSPPADMIVWLSVNWAWQCRQASQRRKTLCPIDIWSSCYGSRGQARPGCKFLLLWPTSSELQLGHFSLLSSSHLLLSLLSLLSSYVKASISRFLSLYCLAT